MRRPGFEPGFWAWKAQVIAARPSTQTATHQRYLSNITFSLEIAYFLYISKFLQFFSFFYFLFPSFFLFFLLFYFISLKFIDFHDRLLISSSLIQGGPGYLAGRLIRINLLVVQNFWKFSFWVSSCNLNFWLIRFHSGKCSFSGRYYDVDFSKTVSIISIISIVLFRYFVPFHMFFSMLHAASHAFKLQLLCRTLITDC